jgi:Zn-dependent M28 family amino/carboxypeptidase
MRMRISRQVRVGVATVAILTLVLGRVVEMRRMAAPVAPVTEPRSIVRLDTERMVLDLQILASDRFQGRATDTPGGAMAAQLVASRFDDLGLSRFGDSYNQPFSFVHRSIRALWRRNRPFTKSFNGTNVVGYVKGTSAPGEFVVVSAHYDHLGMVGGDLYHGADDNASGTAALLAIAAYVQAHPLSRTTVFAAFDAEELGLRGSRAFVAALPFPREQLRLDVNIDMIGRSDGGRLFVAGVHYTPDLRPVVEAAARTSTVPVRLGHDRPPYLAGLVEDWTNASDQGSFHHIGVPFLYFGVEDHHDVHEPTDTSDRIDTAFYVGSAETVLSALVAADAH